MVTSKQDDRKIPAEVLIHDKNRFYGFGIRGSLNFHGVGNLLTFQYARAKPQSKANRSAIFPRQMFESQHGNFTQYSIAET